MLQSKRSASGTAPDGDPPHPPAVTVLLADTGTLLLLLGPSPEAPPGTGTVRLADGNALAWRAISWTDAGKAGRVGVGLITAPQAVPALLDGAVVEPADVVGAAWPLPAVGRLDVAPRALAEHVLATGGEVRAVFDFLRHEMLAARDAERASSQLTEFVRGYLDATANQDGFVEIVGTPEGGGLLLQGWALGIAPGELRIGILARDFTIADAAVAGFDRPDLLPPAQGFVAFIKDAREVGPETVRGVFCEAGARFLYLEVVQPHRILLGEADAVAHLADMLPRLRAVERVLRSLKRVCRPRFRGRDTVGELDAPVRIAVDLVLAEPGAGILVIGWLLDPQARAWLVLLKSTGNFYARLDERWVRLPRPDLSEAFAADPLFRDRLRPNDRLHGFLAWLPRTEPIRPDERFYLELVTDEERCAFLPVEPEAGRGRHYLRRILASIGLDDPELDRIVRDHLVPFAAAVARARPAPRPLCRPLPLGEARPAPAVSAVIPLGPGWPEVETLLARLAGDADFASVELVFAAARDRAAGLAERLQRAVSFYGLGGTLVLAAESLDAAEAVELGARAARGELLLCLRPNLLPRDPGWLGRLRAELARAPAAGLVCPTLLYEDESIRFAGDRRDPVGVPGGARRAGYPAGWLDERATTSVAHGPAECFLLPRRLFLAAGGLVGGLLGAELAHLDLAERLRAEGHQCFWVPDVRLWAVDDPAGADEGYWQEVARVIDRAAFTARWAAADAGIEGAAP